MESVTQFVKDLRRLPEHCDYGNTLESMLRDRLVCGNRNNRVQRRLLAEPNLTFQKAFDIAQVHVAELASKSARDLQWSREGVEAEAVKVMNSRADKPSCHCCNGQNRPGDCQFKAAECYKCGKKGHVARACRSRPVGKGEQVQQMSKEGEGTQKPDDCHQSEHTYSSKLGQMVTVCINKVKLEMGIDTGASASIISEQTYEQLWASTGQPLLRHTDVLLRTYTGERLEIRGVINVSVDYLDIYRKLNLLVVAGIINGE